MKLEHTYIDKKGIRRFYHPHYRSKLTNKVAGDRAYKITCSECGEIGFIRKHSIGRNSNHCSKECQRMFMWKKEDKRPNWNGGKYRGGQYHATMMKGHPRATRDGYVADHLLEMEKKIGRPVRKDEIVHHIDLDKKNNHISNLYLTDKTNHPKIHHQMNLLVVSLLKNGLVRFKNGKYIYKKNIDTE